MLPGAQEPGLHGDLAKRCIAELAGKRPVYFVWSSAALMIARGTDTEPLTSESGHWEASPTAGDVWLCHRYAAVIYSMGDIGCHINLQ